LERVTGYGPTIDLDGGPFAPGATPEPDGTSEIEIDIVGAPKIGPSIAGSKGSDSVELGTLPSGNVGLNLNAADEGGVPDVDVTMPPDGIFSAGLRSGNDRLDASGGSALPDYPAAVELYLIMGPDADRAVGGGQDGAIVGGIGRDRIAGGLGPDRIGAGPGDDSVFVRRGGKDSVECGKGADAYAADSRDDLDHCERRGAATEK
jgi:hypothetical protein